jgi:hypothetical protein
LPSIEIAIPMSTAKAGERLTGLVRERAAAFRSQG